MKTRKDVEVKISQDNGTEKVVKIYVVRPSNNTIKNADRHRAKTWNQCITDGILTKKELSKILKDRGIWDKNKEQEEVEIINKIQSLERKLYLGAGFDGQKAKISDGQKIAIEMRRLRIALRDLIAEKISMEENTAEALSDNAKFDYFVADCTYYENGEKVYTSIEEYNKKSSDEIAFSAASALAEMLYQVDSKFEESLPENKWLKKFNLVNQDLSLVNKNGELVDLDGRKITEDGYYLNNDGKRIDRDGNLLDDDGNYLVQFEYEDDLNTVAEESEEDSSKETKKKKKAETTIPT